MPVVTGKVFDVRIAARADGADEYAGVSCLAIYVFFLFPFA
jgi:hypothetical protein